MTAAAFLMTGGGLALLFFGGEFLLRGAVAVALRSGLSPLLIGLTIVACATSMPELLVTVTAGLKGVTDVGVGNVIGSNIANILLILGVAALLRPIDIAPKLVLRDTIVMLSATVLFIVFALNGEIGLFHGGAMLAALLIYLWVTYRIEKTGSGKASEEVLGHHPGRHRHLPARAGHRHRRRPAWSYGCGARQRRRLEQLQHSSDRGHARDLDPLFGRR